MRRVFILLLSLASYHASLARMITVDDDGPADFASIQSAINDSNDGDIIVVLSGRYYENIDFRGVAITLTNSNPNDPISILNTIIDANGDGIAVSFHMDEDSNSILSGFTITGGNAEYGGGIVCWENCSPIIEKCYIIDNSATLHGGGMYCSGNANPRIVDCIFSSNSATNFGGGMYCSYGNPTLSGCTFTMNSAYGGGGMYCHYSDPTLTKCTFINGLAESFGGGMCCINASPELINCTFNNNTSLNGSGGGMYAWHHSHPIVNGCTFTSNSSKFFGGGIFCDNCCNPILSNCIFTANSATGFDSKGGGLFCFNFSSPTASNCVFSGNSADIGGGIYMENNTATVNNCTFVGNYAVEDGAGIYLTDNSSSVIKNNIICNSRSGSGIYAMYSSPVIRYNNVYGNIDGDYGGWAWPGEGDISVDPHFVDSGHWEDPHSTPEDITDDVWFKGDYHLKSESGRWKSNIRTWVIDIVTSACIDAGEPNSDWTAELWPHGKRINMGAYGGTAQSSMSLSSDGNIADLNNDGSVDNLDLYLLSDNWITEQVLQSTDMDRNGIVDARDYSIFAMNWFWQE